MSAKHGVLCQKTATAEVVDLSRSTVSLPSEAIKEVINDANLKSLEELLGPNSEQKARELVLQYWKNK